MPPPRKRNPAKHTRILFLLPVGAVVALAVFIAFRSNVTKTTPSPAPALSNSIDVPDKTVFAQYGGSESCKSCHETEFKAWQSSHHGLAERDIDPGLDASAFRDQPKIIHGTQTSQALATNDQFELIT